MPSSLLFKNAHEVDGDTLRKIMTEVYATLILQNCVEHHPAEPVGITGKTMQGARNLGDIQNKYNGEETSYTMFSTLQDEF